MSHRNTRARPRIVSRLLTCLVLVIVAIGQSGCVSSLGYVPEAVKIRQMTSGTNTPASDGPRYEDVVTWADDVADGYDSRATMNRNALYGGALLGVAAASTLSALAIFSPGNPAIKGMPVGAAFASGTMAIYNHDQKADLYDRAGKYVRRLILESRERRNYRLFQLSQAPDVANAAEAICLEWDVLAAIKKVSIHVNQLNPVNVVQALAAIPATPTTTGGTGATDPQTTLNNINNILRSVRGNFSDLDVKPDARLNGHCTGVAAARSSSSTPSTIQSWASGPTYASPPHCVAK